MRTYDLLAGLPLVVESYGLEPLERDHPRSLTGLARGHRLESRTTASLISSDRETAGPLDEMLRNRRPYTPQPAGARDVEDVGLPLIQPAR